MTHLTEGWKYVLNNETQLRRLVRQCCRGQYHLCEDIWCDVVIARTPRLVEVTYDGSVPLEAYVIRSLRWYIFKWLNGKGTKALCEDIDMIDESQEPMYTVDHDVSDEVQYLLRGLDEYDRSILIMHLIAGHNLTEIGDILGVSKGTARNHYLRALERARENID